MTPRSESKPAQVDSGPAIIRVKENGGQVYRMKWNGGAYAITTEVVTVYEDSGDTPLTMESGEERLAFWRPAPQRWEVCPLGEEGEPGPPGDGDELERFVLTASKNITDVSASAVIAGTADEIRVVEPDSSHPRYRGYGPYTDPEYGSELGYSGIGLKFTANYSGSGFPGYYIITMEGQARFIVGKCVTNKDSGDSFALVTLDFDLGKYWGAFPNNRRPAHGVLEGGGTGGADLPVIQVYHPTLAADQWVLSEDDVILAVYDESVDGYKIVPTPQDQRTRTVLITETIPAADWDDATNTLTSQSFTCFVFPSVLTPRTFSPDAIDAYHDFPVDITVSEGKARFGFIEYDGKLANLPCPEFDWTPPEEE